MGAWNLHTWRAVRSTGCLPAIHEKEVSEHWIWNEGVPADVPQFEGWRVILLGAPSYLRTWAAQRAFGMLRADLTVEARITPEDVRGWLRRMAAG